MKFIPLHDRVLVRRADLETVSDGGIVLAPSKNEKPNRGTVLAVGPGKHHPNGTFVATTLKEGDTVLFGKNIGFEVTVDDEKLLVLTENDVYGKIT